MAFSNSVESEARIYGALLALQLANVNNNNANAPISDTLDPRTICLESRDSVALNKSVGRETLTVQNESELQAGPDGPLLLALLLNNNNNNPANVEGPISDTLDPRTICLEFGDSKPLNEPVEHEIVADQNESELQAGPDGPIVLALLLNNQNNNPINTNVPLAPGPDPWVNLNSIKAAVQNGTPIPPIVDTLDPRTVTLEHKKLMIRAEEKAQGGPDGPLLFAMLLGNQNNNNGQNGASQPSQGQPSQNQPMSDTLDPRVQVLELQKPQLEGVSTGGTLKLRGYDPIASHARDALMQSWKNNGYLILPNALSPTVIAELVREVKTTAENFFNESQKDSVTVHRYEPDKNKMVSPCGRVLASLNANAFDGTLEPLQRIHRLGCGVHRVMMPFRRAIFSHFHAAMCQFLGYKDPRITQSLVVVKAAGVGPKVIPHQDGCSNFTDPPSCTTFWYALEDATIENGCLAVAPGSHRTEPIRNRSRVNADGQAEFAEINPVYAEIDGADEATLPKRGSNGQYEYKKLEVKAGTLIVMHGNLLHRSEANTSSKGRIAFNFGIVEGTHEWKEDNFLQPYEGWSEFEKLQALY